MDNTAIIFTSDHGFYFGEHGGLFGKLTFDTKPNGALYVHGEEGTTLDYSPLYEELVKVPLLIYFPGALPSVSTGLSSAVDLMPTVLDMLGQAVPDFVDGESLLPRVADAVDVGREFVVSTIPFANPGETTRSFDHIERQLRASPATTITGRALMSRSELTAAWASMTVAASSARRRTFSDSSSWARLFASSAIDSSEARRSLAAMSGVLIRPAALMRGPITNPM